MRAQTTSLESLLQQMPDTLSQDGRELIERAYELSATAAKWLIANCAKKFR